MNRTTVLAVLWQWTEGPHKGARFWGCHSIDGDGRIRDWPKLGLQPLAAAKVEVVEGTGLDLLLGPSAEGQGGGDADPT